MPAQDCVGGDQAMATQCSGQLPDEGGEDGPVGPVQAWSGVGAAQDGDFVAQDEEFDVLGRRTCGPAAGPARAPAGRSSIGVAATRGDHAHPSITAGQRPGPSSGTPQAVAARANTAPDARAVVALTSLFETPSVLRLVSVEQVAEDSGLAVDVCRAVLDDFGIASDGRSAVELLDAFVDGRNPMAGKGIISTTDRGYLVLPGAIALDEVRRTCEQKIKKTRSWDRYHVDRDKAAENSALDAVLRLVRGRGDLYRSLEYRAKPRPGEAVDLSASSTTAEHAEHAEADGLLVLDGVAVCVEVKAGDLRPRSRQGGSRELDGDLKKTVREAARQADRLRALIVAHHGLWRTDGTWLDLADVEEVYTVVVSLEDLGPAALAVDQLASSGILAQVELPWIVSWRTLPWSNARRKLPSVEGARIPPTVAGNAPWRSRSIPSMVSAPATIPATSAPIFNPALTPTLAATRTCSRARSSRPMLWASRTAGISPACDTRFGSSNLACVMAAVCNNRIPEVPFRSWRCEPQQPAFSQVKGHFCCHDTPPRTIRTVDPG